MELWAILQQKIKTLSVLETLVQNLRYALRLVRKNSGITAIAVLMLGLGIGINAAICELLHPEAYCFL